MNPVEKIFTSDSEVLVIPEIGINHNGSLEAAKQMADAAKRAGAKLIKHQTHICEDEMCEAARHVIPGNSDRSIYDIMSSCALSEDEELEFKEYVEGLGLMFLSTPFSRAAADRLQRFGVEAFKIGSGELNNYPLIEHIAEFGKPMIISTGMNNLNSIEKAVKIVEKHGNKYALMHTTNLYPTKPTQVRLGAFLELKNAFPGIPTGLSDHTVNNNACIAAMGLGARLVERHFTDRMDRVGPDIVCSMDENTCKELILASQEIPQMLGGHKEALEEERVTIDFAYASVVSIRPISKGDIFTKDNLWVKRPGTGDFPAEKYESLLGKKAAIDIKNDVLIKKEMVTS